MIKNIDAWNKLKNSDDINYIVCSDEFVIIESWQDVEKIEKITGLKIDNLFSDWGFSDEYMQCGSCYNSICTTPGYYGDIPQYHIFDCEIFCGDCIKSDSDLTHEYINSLVNNYKNANKLFNDTELNNLGWINCNCKNNESCHFESGWYEGQNDNPETILKKAIAKHPEYDYIFSLLSVGQFDVHYTLFRRLKQNDE